MVHCNNTLYRGDNYTYMKVKEILSIIERLQEEYTWGGSEDEDGGLIPGCPDFEKAKNEVRLLMKDTKK